MSGPPVLWLHAPEPGALPRLAQMLCLVLEQRPDLVVMVTTPQGTARPDALPSEVNWQMLPESQAALGAFFDRYKPVLGLWATGHVNAGALGAAREAKVPMLLVDAEEEGFAERGWRWRPRRMRQALLGFRHCYAASAMAERAIRRLSAQEAKTTVVGPLQCGARALPHDAALYAQLAPTLAGRSCWLAAGVCQEEVGMVLTAHASASRLAHRMLLLLVPSTAEAVPALRARLEQVGLRVLDWSSGALPDESTQVLLIDEAPALGLWYLLAPVSFLGGTLSPGTSSPDPYEAAALGSAILYGPHVGRWLDRYTALAGVGAARIIKDAPTLSDAVSALVAPDRAAAMARAAWELVTAGAENTDRMAEIILDTLDEVETP